MAQSAMNHQIAVKILPHEWHYSTELDWQKIKVPALCYDLESLVFQSQNAKPDWEIIPQKVHPWTQSVFIDLRHLSFTKEKLALKSPFNAQIHRIDWMLWLEKGVQSLNYYWLMPNIALLSPKVREWVKQLPQDKILQENQISLPSKHWQLLDKTCLAETSDHQCKWLLVEQLCKKTAEGWVWDEKGSYQITEPEWEISTAVLADYCICEACELGLQRSYFHHIYRNVPLLANRYLAWHNFCQLKFCT